MKALVLTSGGVDSTTALALATEKYGKGNVMCLAVYYGQKHSKELESARNVAGYYGAELQELDLAEIFAGSNCSLLKQSDEEIPESSYAEQLAGADGRPVSTYVPFRNGLFLSSAASIALSRGCSVVYYGAHMDDAAGNAYPDCSAAFFDSMRAAVELGSGGQITLCAPFINSTKKDIVAEGLRLGVPYELTWSCYEGHDKACGRCGTCLDRLKAFEANGAADPVPYES